MDPDRNVIDGKRAPQAGLIDADPPADASAESPSGTSSSIAETMQSLGSDDDRPRAEPDRDPGGLMQTLGAVDGPIRPARHEAADDGSATVAIGMGPPAPGGAATIAFGADAPALPGSATVGFGADAPAPVSTGMETRVLEQPTIEGAPTIGFGPGGAGPVRMARLDDSASGEGQARYVRTRMHAQGGIGQVWLARDGDLGRDVALKELKPESSKNPIAWDRFFDEARITGQLEHPGIVPIYELGVDQAGRKPFYTMRFIKGRTLNEAIADYHEKRKEHRAGPLDRAALLNAFVGVCNTVGYAHSRGVIHRDLKGQNVVLGDYGEVILLDWGIAKLIGSPGSLDEFAPTTEVSLDLGSEGAAHEATLQGQVLGTPSYMAPEQAEGRLEAIDHRTDIYGLGAILYEILTGRPPFTGSSTAAVLRMVQQADPEAPSKLDPSTPRALEAICRKAMAKSPEDRYPSALDLARDVSRWLADEPTTVYREPWVVRAGRWSKRHRTAVASVAALLVTTTVASSVAAVLIGKERDEARRQRQFARRAVDDNYTKVAESWLEDRLDPLQREFLENSLLYYREFTGPDANDPAVLEEQGRAHLRMGDVLRKLGRHGEAESTYRRSIEILGRLAEADPKRLEHRDRLAEATFRLGTERATRGRGADLEQADRLFVEASAIQERLVDEAATPDRRAALGRTLANQAEALKWTGRAEKSRATFLEAVGVLDRATADDPAGILPRQELAAALDGLGRLIADRGKAEEAKAAFRRSAGLAEALIAAAPNLPGPRDGLAKTYNSLGLLLRKDGAGEEPESLIRKEIALNQRLADDYPGRPEYRRTLARGLINLGVVCQETNRPREAEESYRKALEINQKLAIEEPSNWKFRRDEARCLQNLGDLLSASAKGESEVLFRKAIEIYDTLAGQAESVLDHRLSAANVRQNLGVWLYGRNRSREATEVIRKAVGPLEELAANDAENLEIRRALARALNGLGNSLHYEKKYREAEDAYRKAVNSYDQLVSRPGATSNERLDLANTLNSRGENQIVGKLPGAGDSLGRSVALMEALAGEGPPSIKLRTRFAAVRSTLGDWLRAAGKLDEAEAAYRVAIADFEALHAEAPTNPDFGMYLGDVLGSFAKLRIAQNRPAEAKPMLEDGLKAERAVLALNPRRAPALMAMRKGLEDLATVAVEMGDHATAAKAGDELLKVAVDLPAARTKIALLMARCGPLARSDAKLPEPQRSLRAASFADRAIAVLRDAVESGDAGVDRLLEDAAFDPIRDRDGFKALRIASSEKPIPKAEEGRDLR